MPRGVVEPLRAPRADGGVLVPLGACQDEVAPRRILFGWFPTYRYRSNSPLKPAFDRVLGRDV